jgi:hypothetical protein
VAAAALSIVGATGASAVASQGSAPGDTLYPVKRLIEDAKVSLAMGDDARADALLSQARTRLSEARDLAGRDEIDTAAVSQALEDFTDSADHASGLVLADYADNGDEQAVSDLRRFSQDGVTALSQLADVLPDSLHGPLTDAVNTLLAIDDSAAQACPSCDGGITVLPTTLIDLLASTTGTTAGTTGAEPSASGAAVSPPSATVPTTAPAPAPSATSQAGEPTDGSKHLPSGAAPTGQPTSSPTSIGGAVGQLGGTLGDTLGGVGGTVGGLGDAVGGPVGGLLGGVGGAVDGLGGTVGGTVGAVGGALDGVLGGATQTPKP